jgi:hypothetical protein
MGKSRVNEDKRLYDAIKEIWEVWINGSDPDLEDVEFVDFLKGYLACYYKGETEKVAEAITFFQYEIDNWQNEIGIDY